MSVISPTSAPAPERGTKQALWDAFCDVHGIARTGIPLFAESASGTVGVFGHDLSGRQMLRRLVEMEELLAGTVERVLATLHGEAEGVLYLMHRFDAAGRMLPLYVGKAGCYERSGTAFANLLSIRTNGGKFSRWGYG